MEFYLNQKSLPMIRKCSSCRFYYADYKSCSLMRVTNAFDHQKNIFLTTGDNLYCDKHKFKNEEILREEAIVVEYENIEEAMKVIQQAKELKVMKNDYFNR
jgi:hypothetical protein